MHDTIETRSRRVESTIDKSFSRSTGQESFNFGTFDAPRHGVDDMIPSLISQLGYPVPFLWELMII